MATNFPAGLDAFTNPTGTNSLSDVAVLHSEQHANANDAIEAIQSKLGINASTDVNSVDYKLRQVLARTLEVEVPAGVIDGANTQFTLTGPIVGDTLIVHRNGQIQVPGTYTVVGNVITLQSAPTGADTLVVTYMKQGAF